MKKKLNPSALMAKAKDHMHPKKPVLPDFQIGDTVKVHVRVTEGEKTRVQIFEGLVLAMKGGGLSSSFLVRKISYGVGVERVFPFYSPVIEKVTIISRGEVRRAKLYYLRELSGRASRIKSEQVFGEQSGESAKAAEASPAPALAANEA